MSELPRLSDTSASPLTRALLDSAKGDRPSEAARRGAAVALGLGLAGGAATTATATHAAASGAAGKATYAAVAWKIVGATIVSGAVAVGVARERAPAPVPAPPVVAAAHEPAKAPPPRVRIAPLSSPELAPPVSPPEPPRVERTVVAPVTPPRPRGAQERAPRGAEADPLRAELALLDDARAALARGDSASAFAALDAHARAFPRGALADEASLLRVEALASSGDRAGAAREASRVLARDPDGPHARRLRAWLESLHTGGDHE